MNTDIRKLAADDLPHFHDDVVENMCDIYNPDLRFFRPDKTIESVDVNLNKVVGHAQMYQPMSWSYMLQHLKRINQCCKDLAENPSYYMKIQEGDKCLFIETEGNYFISAGKHRTTVLKYFAHFNSGIFPDGPIMRGADVISRQIDYALEKDIERIKSLLDKSKFQHLRLGIKRQLAREVSFYIANDARQVKYTFLTRDELPVMIEALESDNLLQRMFGNEYSKYFRKSWFFPW